MRSRDELESEEMAKFKELYPDTPLDEEEAVFKKPKTTKVCVCIHDTYIPCNLYHYMICLVYNYRLSYEN